MVYLFVFWVNIWNSAFTHVPTLNTEKFFVDQDATGGLDNGTNWSNAFLKLKDALATASYGDTIWVAEGTYLPTVTNDRSISFELKNGVAIYGGFDGSENTLEARDWVAHPTILSGDIGVPDDSSDNSFHVLHGIGLDSTSLLDGFTITEGHASPSDPSPSYAQLGGGLILEVSHSLYTTSFLIQNCSFENNSAKEGGAVYFESDDLTHSLRLRNCTFYENVATLNGGAIGLSGSINIEACIFEQNQAGAHGGGINFLNNPIDVLVNNCDFRTNLSTILGGGIFYDGGLNAGTIRVDSSRFESNSSPGGGGGFGMLLFGAQVLGRKAIQVNFNSCSFKNNKAVTGTGGALTINSAFAENNVSILDCEFVNNWAQNPGGAMDVGSVDGTDITLFIDRCRFQNNRSASPVGGALRVHSVFSQDVRVNLKLYNTLFQDNRGGISLFNAQGSLAAKIYNSTFVHNGPYTILKPWDPNFNETDYFAKADITNCIFWEPDVPLELMLYNNDPVNFSFFNYQLRNNLFSADLAEFPGVSEAFFSGNQFLQNPQFIDELNGNYHLQGCSPGINAGLNLGEEIGVFDLAGDNRLEGGHIDIGAYEQPKFELAIEQIEVVKPSCHGENDGQVNITTNGAAPLSYEWSTDEQVGVGNSALGAGLYNFTITDQNNCQEQVFLSVNEPEVLEVEFNKVPPNAGERDGQLEVSILGGGTPPFRFFWSTGDTTRQVDSLAKGTYGLTVTDANNCDSIFSLTLEDVNAIPQYSSDGGFYLWPNPIPAYQQLSLSTPENKAGTFQISLFDSKGRKIHTSERTLYPSKVEQFSSVAWSTGLYFMQIKPLDGSKVFLLKLVVQ